MRSLGVLQKKYLEKFYEMRSDKEFSGKLTCPHLTVPPASYDPDRIPSVLYVGKAAGPNGAEEGNPTKQEILCKTRKYLKCLAAGECSTGFWNFARRLSKALAYHSGHPEIAPLQNLVWTNICKIGVRRGNPPKNVFEAQKELAVETLRAEMDHYRPRLVFWATWHYGLDVVRDVVDDQDETFWCKEFAENGIYQRGPMNSLPAMLWTYHPQGKPKEDLDLWVEQACKLVKV